MTSLALSLLIAVSAGADGDQACREIRSVDRLAKQEHLDRATLQQLKRLYCRHHGEGHHEDWDDDEDDRRQPEPQPPPQQVAPGETADCHDLTIMTRLAKMTDSGSMLATVDRQRALACAMHRDLQAFNWPNGALARFAGGGWRYPNGTTARYADGSWHYANGMTARYADGTWRYPNGTTARFADGSWQAPNGARRDPVQLLMDSGVPPDVAAKWRNLPADERELTLIEAVWAARRR